MTVSIATRRRYPGAEDGPLFETVDPAAANVIGTFLRDVGYGCFVPRLARGLDPFFPEFGALQRKLEGLARFYSVLYTLFWQGHSASDAVVRLAFPPAVMEAFVATGLLRPDGKNWRTPGMAVLPVEGLNLVVALPPPYPTAMWRKQPVYIGLDSTALMAVIPPSLRNKSVLDLCAGSGVQALTCLSRGAERAVAVERHPATAAVARFNASLNGLADRLTVVQADLRAGIPTDEVFDFVLCNPPFMPVMEDVDYPMCADGGVDGTEVLEAVLGNLNRLVGPDGRACLVARCLGDQWSINVNKTKLTETAHEGPFQVRCLVTDKTAFAMYEREVRSSMPHVCPELSHGEIDERIAGWKRELVHRQVAHDYVYFQILTLHRCQDSPRVEHLPFYDITRTDPIVRLSILSDRRDFTEKEKRP